MKRIALDHVAGLKRKIAELNQMAATLTHLAECCSGDHRPDCPILDELEKAPELAESENRRRRGAMDRPLQ